MAEEEEEEEEEEIGEERHVGYLPAGETSERRRRRKDDDDECDAEIRARTLEEEKEGRASSILPLLGFLWTRSMHPRISSSSSSFFFFHIFLFPLLFSSISS